MDSMTSASDFDRKYEIYDANTPRHTLMSGRYKQSFAYYTLRERLPVTLTCIIDNLARDKDEMAAEYGEDSREEIKKVVGQLSKLKYQLQTDKPLEMLTGNEPDKDVWNAFIKTLPSENHTFFKACWLYSECYMYRKVSSFFEDTNTLKNFDYFAKQKKNALVISLEAMEAVVQSSRKFEKNGDCFMQLLKLNLWGNRCDLSITSGKEVKPASNPAESNTSFDANLLINDAPAIWNCIEKAISSNPQLCVDFICDNAGYEIFTDFILADYIIEKNLASKVRFHIKTIPWFISDVTLTDFRGTLQYLREQPSHLLSDIGKKWTQFLEEGKFVLMPEQHFWTSPYEFYRMRNINPDLYKQLAESHLLIFKGDLNYRKLLGDYTWDDTEDFITCLRGFIPTNLCTLRTIKADLICGLREGQSQEMNKKHPGWMLTGEFGVIQFCEAVECGCKSRGSNKPE